MYEYIYMQSNSIHNNSNKYVLCMNKYIEMCILKKFSVFKQGVIPIFSDNQGSTVHNLCQLNFFI